MAIEYIQAALRKLSILQQKHLILMLLLIALFTAFSIVGITKTQIESDFSKFNPEGIPILDLEEEIADKFNSLQSFIILVQIDNEDEAAQITDIRDPAVIEFLVRLEKNLQEEIAIQEVLSVGSIFTNSGIPIPDSLEGVKAVLSQIPGGEQFFSKDFSLTSVIVGADIGTSEDKIRGVNDRVQDIVERSSVPGGIKIVVTGEPPLFAVVFNLLIRDAFNTFIFATIVIFFLLLIIVRSLTRATLILLPLLFGVTWTLGTLGWVGIPLTIGTVGLSAMLLGLGVEYSIFLISRYSEERQKHDRGKALENALSGVGSSITGSGLTTMIGFGALSLSIFPFLADLGKSLAIGIGFMLAATIFTAPIFISFEDSFIKRFKRQEPKNKKDSLITIIFARYARFVSRKPFLVLVIAIVSTGFVFTGIGMIETKEVNFDTVLPADLEELKAFTILRDEFGDTGSATIYLRIEPTSAGTDEPQDIRDPRVLRYIDILTQKVSHLPFVERSTSISTLVKEANDGFIPVVSSQNELFNTPTARTFINDDFSASRIRIVIFEGVIESGKEIADELQALIDETEKPVGIFVALTGTTVIEPILDEKVGPDSAKTSIYAFASIIIVLLILTRSIKFTILPLMTVVLAIVWTLGLIGLLDVGWNNITSSVITMTIGIGIDFGLQLMVRYRQELEKEDKRLAMENTLKNVLVPMIITTIAALIGFRAMSFGELKVMGQLGTVMSFGVASSMIVAITAVASLMVIFQKDKKKKV